MTPGSGSSTHPEPGGAPTTLPHGSEERSPS
nr:MAG TPA: hypothetical protein [Caudoviricetes sp.]